MSYLVYNQAFTFEEARLFFSSGSFRSAVPGPMVCGALIVAQVHGLCEHCCTTVRDSFGSGKEVSLAQPLECRRRFARQPVVFPVCGAAVPAAQCRRDACTTPPRARRCSSALGAGLPTPPMPRPTVASLWTLSRLRGCDPTG